MQFAVVVERALGPGFVVGPFAHEEDAHAWASTNIRMKIWRVELILAPGSPMPK